MEVRHSEAMKEREAKEKVKIERMREGKDHRRKEVKIKKRREEKGKRRLNETIRANADGSNTMIHKFLSLVE